MIRNGIGWICFIFLATTGECLDTIGKVVAVDGVLRAMNQDGVERIALKDSDIFLGDLLITEELARGQIQFTDGTLVLLIPGTRYSIDAYAHSWGRMRYLAKLTQGGVRIATGLIAKKVPENFEVMTPNATIGVRGTLFETRLLLDNVYVGSSVGDLSIKNTGGKLAVGSDQYAVVSSEETQPQPLADRPDALDLAYFQVPAGGVPFGEAGPVGAAAVASSRFAWGPAIGSMTVFGVVVGLVVSAATKSVSTFGHSAFFVHAPRNQNPP